VTPSHIAAIEFRDVTTFPAPEDIEDFELFGLSLRTSTTRWTHGLHRFPAKFVPQVPAWALEHYGDRDAVVLDPFVGSGTTLVESAVSGVPAIGVELDPLARLIAAVKVDPPDAAALAALAMRLRGPLPASGHAELPMAGVANPLHWFGEQTLDELSRLWHAILALSCTERERNFLIVVFSSVLRRVSNADDQSQKTYVSGTNPKSPPPALETFHRALDKAIAMASAYRAARRGGAHVRVLPDGDARGLPLASESIDLIVTSPPYLDSVDYMYNLMVEYFWLGPLLGVPDRPTFNALRRKPVGAKSPTADADDARELRDVLDIDAVAPARQRAAARYFADMRRHFAEAARCLRPGGRYVLVIGNSQTRDLPLPVHDALLVLALSAGLALERAFAYRVRRHYMKFPRGGRGGIILLDWVLTLRAGDTAATSVPRLPLPHVKLSARDVAN
jgi:DNA modification methylase